MIHDERLDRLTFVVFDTETTGFHPDRHRVLEIAAIRFRYDGQVLGQFQTLIDLGPDHTIPVEALAVHGITEAMVRQAPSADAALAAFNQFARAVTGWSDGNEVMVAHKATFDIGMLEGMARRSSVPSGMAFSHVPPVICTLDLVHAHLPDLKHHDLATVAKHYEIPQPQAHRALADCITTKKVLHRLLAEYPTAAALMDVRGCRLYRLTSPVPLTAAEEQLLQH